MEGQIVVCERDYEAGKMAMEVGSSSCAPRARGIKPADMPSTSRGHFLIATGDSVPTPKEHFHRSDSVPKLEDLIAGDARLEELLKGDAEPLKHGEGEGGAETEEEDGGLGESSTQFGRCGEPGHSLRFLTDPPYPCGAYVCNNCARRDTGEVYHCETCMFDLCPSCAVSTSSTVEELASNVSSSENPTASALEMPSSWGQPLLGCWNPSHALASLVSAPYDRGAYLCNLCLKTGEEQVYHCTSCTDFDLHPECAKVTREIRSFTHPHGLVLQPPYTRGFNAICDGCLECLGGSQWVYRCNSGCDFDLHARCAKYARRIFHPVHAEHELVLLYESMAGPNSHVMCDGCDCRVESNELIYHCEECGFDLHPTCAVGYDVARS